MPPDDVVDLTSDIDDLLGELTSDPEPEPAPEPESEPVEDIIDPEPELESKPEPESTSESEPEPEPESEPEDEVAVLKAQNEALLARLDLVEQAKEPAPEPAPVAEPGVPEVVEPGVDSKISFVSEDDDIDEILAKREKLNEFAMKIYLRAVEDGARKGREATMQSVPGLVMGQIQRQTYLRDTIKTFFDEHEPLKVARKTVGAISNEVASDHPDWELPKVLEETAERSYKALGLKKKAIGEKGGENNSNRERNPALPDKGTGGRKKSADQRSGLQKEIDDIIL